MKTKTNVKAGGFIITRNHSRKLLKVRAGLKAGGIDVQHNRALLS